MAYNPSYGGQFLGLSGGGKKTTSAPLDKKAASGGDKGDSEGSSAQGEQGEKVIVHLGQLKQVGLEELKEGDERRFIVVALFEGDDLNKVVNRTRNRTKPVTGKFLHSNYICSFAGENIVLPIADPSKRLLLYLCGVTIKSGSDESGQSFKDISVMGIGFSEPFSVQNCKKYPHVSAQLRQVEGGDPGIAPGILDVSIDVCKMDKGDPIPDDAEESIMAQFQA